MRRLIATSGLVLLASMCWSQQTDHAMLESRYEALQVQIEHAQDLKTLDRLIKEQAPLAAQLDEIDRAQLTVNSSHFFQYLRIFSAANPEIQFLRCEDRWHRTRFWNKLLVHGLHDPCKISP